MAGKINAKQAAVIKISVGALMLASVIAGYLPIPQLMVEFTCISNTLGGLLLICDGILNLKGKATPCVLYRNISVGIFFVFAICAGSLSGAYHMNLKGAFFILHIVTPILFIMCYILLCDEGSGNALKKLLAAPCLMIAYLLFDHILGKVGGEYVYGFFEPDEVSITDALIIGAVFYVMLLAPGGLFMFLNQKAHRQ